MSKFADRIISKARSLVGVPFRPQGRDPGTGLDCVGLVLSAFGLPAGDVRRDYRLSGAHLPEIEAELARRFRRVSAGQRGPGDILLFSISAGQAHLAIDCGGSFIHADARLRRVVETPGQPAWAIVGTFRGRRTRRRSD